VTLTELRHFLEKRLPEYARYLDLFASPQIKNIASLVGNIANASPIGDNAPVLLALDAQLELLSNSGSRLIDLKDFFLDYRKVALKKGELIRQIHFPLPGAKNFFRLFKNSLRKDLDISTLNLACHIEGEQGNVRRIRLAAGGIAAIPLRLKKTESYLTGKTIDNKTIADAVDQAQTEFTPLSDVRASAAYRRIVLGNLLTRSLREFAQVKL
jgi:xanthine dehydrogenase small subunit